jgi:hypothetical protein
MQKQGPGGQDMDGDIVASGVVPSYEFVTYGYGSEVLHRIKVTGPIDLSRRLPLYRETLAVNPSRSFFCIVDNSGGHENDMTFSDIVVLDDLLIEAGIEFFYGATVTRDQAYSNIVKLANMNVQKIDLDGELLATSDPDEAEKFIMEKLNSARAGGSVPRRPRG